MDKYDYDKYKFIDDRGAVAIREDAGPNEQGAASANPNCEVGEHGAIAHPFVVEIDDGATAFPLTISVEDEGAAAANLDREVGEHGGTAHPFVVAIDGGVTAFPFRVNVADERAAAANLDRKVGEHGATVHPFVAAIEDGARAFPLGIKVGEESGAAHSFKSDEKDIDASAYLHESDTLPYLSENEEEDFEDSECPHALEEEDIDDPECPLLIEEKDIDLLPSSLEMDDNGLGTLVCPPVTDADNQDAAAIQSVKEARGDEEPKTCQLENTEDEQDDIGKHMEDRGDAVDLCDEEVGVQESNGYQLTAVDTDETGNDEDEESSEATPFVQD
ncbi:uncharacterized protein LOC111343377 [Stylophora pistillata]|uniref:uncharacterized protein LOC111343377 n=1 Tax=Stylophora pistillata TaxID=50429 RepID=UPI000C0405A1|nr:uncharacterized protein LOC111343377 [Stylophora pistillata]